MTKTDVTAGQYFSVSFLSLTVGTFLYVSSSGVKPGSPLSVMLPVLLCAVNLLLSVPLLKLINRCRDDGILDFCERRSHVLSKLIAALYALTFIYALIRTAARFDLFASAEMFSQSSTAFFTALLLLICAALSFKGLASLCRAGVIFAAIVFAGTSTVLLLAFLRDFDILNFAVITKPKADELIVSSLDYAFFPVETGALTLFCGRIKGNIKKSYRVFLMLSSLFLLLTAAAVTGSLGAFADTQLFPVYALSTVHGIGLAERLDAVQTAVWLFCIICKMTFFILIIKECLNHLFGNNKKLPFCAAVGAVAVFSVAVSRNIINFKTVSSFGGTAAAYLLSVAVIPAFALLICRFKSEKTKGGFITE